MLARGLHRRASWKGHQEKENHYVDALQVAAALPTRVSITLTAAAAKGAENTRVMAVVRVGVLAVLPDTAHLTAAWPGCAFGTLL